MPATPIALRTLAKILKPACIDLGVDARNHVTQDELQVYTHGLAEYHPNPNQHHHEATRQRLIVAWLLGPKCPKDSKEIIDVVQKQFPDTNTDQTQRFINRVVKHKSAQSAPKKRATPATKGGVLAKTGLVQIPHKPTQLAPILEERLVAATSVTGGQKANTTPPATVAINTSLPSQKPAIEALTTTQPEKTTEAKPVQQGPVTSQFTIDPSVRPADKADPLRLLMLCMIMIRALKRFIKLWQTKHQARKAKILAPTDPTPGDTTSEVSLHVGGNSDDNANDIDSLLGDDDETDSVSNPYELGGEHSAEIDPDAEDDCQAFKEAAEQNDIEAVDQLLGSKFFPEIAARFKESDYELLYMRPYAVKLLNQLLETHPVAEQGQVPTRLTADEEARYINAYFYYRFFQAGTDTGTAFDDPQIQHLDCLFGLVAVDELTDPQEDLDENDDGDGFTIISGNFSVASVTTTPSLADAASRFGIHANKQTAEENVNGEAPRPAPN